MMHGAGPFAFAAGPPRGPGSPQAEPVLKVAPPHLTLGAATPRPPGRMHTTCVAFGSRGDKVCMCVRACACVCVCLWGRGGLRAGWA